MSRAVISYCRYDAPRGIGPRRAIVSYAVLEPAPPPPPPASAIISWVQMEAPRDLTGPRRARVSWVQAEVPEYAYGPRRALVSFLRVDTPLTDVKVYGNVSLPALRLVGSEEITVTSDNVLVTADSGVITVDGSFAGGVVKLGPLIVVEPINAIASFRAPIIEQPVVSSAIDVQPSWERPVSRAVLVEALSASGS